METEVSLPEDVLADILERLPPRDLAQSRRVCRSWGALVDARRLLLRHALPHSVQGFFLNYVCFPWPLYRWPHFLSRPSSSGPRIDGRLSFLPKLHGWSSIRDHHNGLCILYSDRYSKVDLFVINPATRQWTALPPLKDARTSAAYIVFEPAVSPHYEVFLVPPLPKGSADEGDDDPYGLMEWPPSPYVFQVFSSKTGRWEERAFVREGEAAGLVADLRFQRYPFRPIWCHAVRLQGTLYIHCRGAYVMRLSLPEEKYQVIKTPISITECAEARSYLGCSQNRVCFAAIQELHQLRVWILKESSGVTDWVLKHRVDVALSYHDDDQINKEWTLEDDSDVELYTNIPELEDDRSEEGSFSGSLFGSSSEEKETAKVIVEENIFEWNSDDDNVLRINDQDEGNIRHISILGFHPYKEVIFLADEFDGLACQLNTLKFQFLGSLDPKSYNYSLFEDIESSFLYTPCMIGELAENISSQGID